MTTKAQSSHTKRKTYFSGDDAITKRTAQPGAATSKNDAIARQQAQASVAHSQVDSLKPGTEAGVLLIIPGRQCTVIIKERLTNFPLDVIKFSDILALSTPNAFLSDNIVEFYIWYNNFQSQIALVIILTATRRIRSRWLSRELPLALLSSLIWPSIRSVCSCAFFVANASTRSFNQ
jgi:hypothetical protein